MICKLLLIVTGCSLACSKVRADLLVDPANSTQLQSNGTYDNVVSSGRSLGFTGLFFGVPHQTVDVSTNGNLNFSHDNSFADTPLPTSVARISPLWDDLVVSGSTESVSEKVVSGMYYTVTWQAHENNTGADVAFQATWFGATTQIKNFNFLAGDIAFSYAVVTGNFSDGDATIGLDRGNNLNFTSLPGDDNGSIKNGLVSLLPTGAGQFMLFRPNGAAYTASIVPEPSTCALCLVSILTLGYLFKRSGRVA